MKKFCSIYLDTEKKDLMKPNGLIPYTLNHTYNYECTIATYNNGYDYNDTNIEGVKVDFIQKKFNNRALDGVFYLIKNSKRIDILHTFFWKKENYFWFFIYKLLNPKGKIYVGMDADSRIKREDMINSGIKGKIKTHFLKKCNLISVETIDLQKWLSKNWYRDIKYVPYGVLTSDKKIDYSKKKNQIITVGRIGTYQKANEILLEAFCKSKIYEKGWILKVIGPIEEEFKDYIDNFFKTHFELKKYIEFTGPIFDRKKLMKIYEETKIFCLTSRYESFGLVLSEAASRGCYILSTKIAPAIDITNKEKYGKLFEIDDIDGLSKLLIRTVNNENELEKKCKEVQDYINNNFSWNSVCKKALRYLNEEEGYEKK